MQGLWWNGNENSLTLHKDMVEPKIQDPHDIKIKVAFSGICGSDIHYMSGRMGKMQSKPDGIVLGHEFSGTIVEAGSESYLKAGDKVCVNPNDCCGKCQWSFEKLPQFCPNNFQVGVQHNGGWAQYCVVKDSMALKLPEGITLEQGALGEPISCVLRGWKRLNPLPSQDAKILVQGAGIIGSLFCLLLHHNGYANVTVVELSEERRKLFRGMNLNFDVVDPQEIDLMLSGKDIGIHGYQVVIDCTGSTIGVKKAIELARRGGKVMIFGCCAAGKTIQLEPFDIFWKELTILGSFINPFCFEDTMLLLKELALKGYLDYEKLGVKTFTLDQYEEALDSLKKGKASKATFQF